MASLPSPSVRARYAVRLRASSSVTGLAPSAGPGPLSRGVSPTRFGCLRGSGEELLLRRRVVRPGLSRVGSATTASDYPAAAGATVQGHEGNVAGSQPALRALRRAVSSSP